MLIWRGLWDFGRVWDVGRGTRCGRADTRAAILISYSDTLVEEVLVRRFGIRVGCAAIFLWSTLAFAQAREKVIIDTDIGDDVDDAFALALAVKSPELEILGVTTTFGETEVRAQIVDRFFGEIGRTEIPVMAGKATPAKNPMSQRRYAEQGRFSHTSHGDAVEFILDQIRKH